MDNVNNYAPHIASLARLIMARLEDEEGMTLEWSGADLKPRNAYIVGGVVPSLVIDVQDDYAAIVLALTKWLASNHGLMHYAPIGVWRENGHLYFDLVTVLPDIGTRVQETAEALARNRGELAYGEFDRSGNYAETHTV